MTHPDNVISAIVGAIAESEGCQPDELEYSLHEYIETDGLAKLVAAEQTDWHLTIQVPDHTVEVHGGGQIYVDDNPRRRVGPENHAGSASESKTDSDQL